MERTTRGRREPAMITVQSFGRLPSGREVRLYRLQNAAGASASILDYGCRVQSLMLPDRTGALHDVCLGYDSLEAYLCDDAYLGALLGRCAGRIPQACLNVFGRRFSVSANEGENCLHGGFCGFDSRLWDARVEEDAVVFSRRSPAGEEGFPGNLAVRAAVCFTDSFALSFSLWAQSDADTAVSLSSHAYFDLSNGGGAAAHALWVDAEALYELGPDLAPTGRKVPLAGTPLDFRAPQPLRPGDLPGGYDHAFALTCGGVKRRASLVCPGTGIAMDVFTDQPCLQLYTAGGLSARNCKGRTAGPMSAVCLEAQGVPGGEALRAGGEYRKNIVYAFGAAQER